MPISDDEATEASGRTPAPMGASGRTPAPMGASGRTPAPMEDACPRSGPPNPSEAIRELFVAALREDVGAGDITTASLELEGCRARATVRAKADGVLCGVSLLRLMNCDAVLHMPLVGGASELIARIEGVTPSDRAVSAYAGAVSVPDGARVAAGQVLAEFVGDATVLLAIERTLLNLLCHLSGVATLTARFVAEVTGTGTRICDTRKTLAGIRLAQKYAVRTGGGTNHRMGLWDEAMLKENHLKLSGKSIESAILALRHFAPERRVTCEAENIEQAMQALRGGADCVLLDDMCVADMREVVKLRAQIGREDILLEASGGVSLANVREIALSGVERISIGALTHSAPALDISLKIVPEAGELPNSERAFWL